jgi:hypothetical protein
MAGYFRSFLIVFLGFFVASFLLYNRGLGTLLDPIGVRFIAEDIAHLWIAVEKNWRLLEMEGIVLRNRILWLGIGLLTLAVVYLRFRFAHRTTRASWWRWKHRQNAESLMPAGSDVTVSTPISVPHISETFGFGTNMRPGARSYVDIFSNKCIELGRNLNAGCTPTPDPSCCTRSNGVRRHYADTENYLRHKRTDKLSG